MRNCGHRVRRMGRLLLPQEGQLRSRRLLQLQTACRFSTLLLPLPSSPLPPRIANLVLAGARSPYLHTAVVSPTVYDDIPTCERFYNL